MSIPLAFINIANSSDACVVDQNLYAVKIHLNATVVCNSQSSGHFKIYHTMVGKWPAKEYFEEPVQHI